MRTWTVVLLLWIAPALLLLAALVRANIRKAARRRNHDDVAKPLPRQDALPASDLAAKSRFVCLNHGIQST